MIPDLLSRLGAIVLAEIPSDRCVFLAVDGSGQLILDGPDSAGNGALSEVEEDAVRRALDSGRPLLIADAAAGQAESPGGTGNGCPRSILCFPWRIRGRPPGVVCLSRSARGQPFSRQNVEFLALALAPAQYVLGGNADSGPAPEGTVSPPSDGPFLGSAPSIRNVRTMIDRVKDSDAPVLILGESGTGKELAAKTIHETGLRKNRPFVAVNCGAIPENLIESELFGHARGSFTGAFRDKPGLIEEAGGGTFFLDEVGDLPFALQAKLLRVLEERRVRRVGENRPRPIDVRFISATNKDIEREVARGNFREDLFYRLKIVGIDLPPLRERREDILLLLNRFLDSFSVSMGRPRPFFSPTALEMLLGYSWPGNVRELQNEVQRCLLIAGGEAVIREDYLSAKINPAGQTFSPDSLGYFRARAEFERRFLREALIRCGYHRSRTAAEIGLTRQGLFKLMKKHGLDGRDGAARHRAEGGRGGDS